MINLLFKPLSLWSFVMTVLANQYTGWSPAEAKQKHPCSRLELSEDLSSGGTIASISEALPTTWLIAQASSHGEYKPAARGHSPGSQLTLAELLPWVSFRL